MPVIFLFCFLLFISPSPAIADDNSSIGKSSGTLKEENRLIGIELELAQKGVPYVVLDTSKEKIFLKNRGILLREFKIEKIKFWGRHVLSIDPIPLSKKKAYTLPKRKEIVPHKQEEGASDTSAKEEFLELKDMPYQYTLLFEKGLSIFVKPKSEGRWSEFIYFIRSILRHIYNSFVLVSRHMFKKDYTRIELEMSKEDAQALYWTFSEGMNIVLP